MRPDKVKAPANRKESNLWQNAKTGRWHFEVELRRPDGTSYRRTGSRKTELEARAGRDAAYLDFNTTGGRRDSWTVKTWSEHVQNNVWGEELAATTRDGYAYALKNHVIPKLGGARLHDLEVPTLQHWLNAIIQSQGRNVAQNALTALSSVLTRAVSAGCMDRNPARDVKLRKPQVLEGESKMILTAEQSERLMKASVGTCMEMPVLLGLKFGLRMGECLGLRWTDIDLEAKVLRVRQQAQYIKGAGLQITAPKTRQGTRTIPIPNGLIGVLADAKAHCSSVYVCTRNGEIISSKKASKFFKEVAFKAGFTSEGGVPTHHDLRSTMLTNLANHANGGLGVKPHVLMVIAGHSSLSTTMKYYIRAADEDLRAAMACVA